MTPRPDSPFVVQCNTPEELRSELITWFNHLREDAQRRQRVAHQSDRTRAYWQTRSDVLLEAVDFLMHLGIEAKALDPLDQPSTDKPTKDSNNAF